MVSQNKELLAVFKNISSDVYGSPNVFRISVIWDTEVSVA